MQNRVVVPLIVACALFLQQMDATALATALPTIADALGETPIRLHLVLTAYFFSLAAFVPVSGWVADRFGARLVFRLAIAIFTLSSLACGFSDSLAGLVAARICQGIGGAMMVPVARLILVRSVEKRDLISALTLMSVPALMGPILGPLIGGLLTTYASWRWIFWVNVPTGILGIVLVTLFIPEVKETTRRRFDPTGVLLLSLGLATLLFGVDAAASDSASGRITLGCIVFGAACLLVYVRHARRRAEPVLDLSLLKIETFRASVGIGSLFRVGTAAMPFLLPLLFQMEFGYTAAESGAITFVAAVGALGSRTVTTRILRRFGFRPVLIWNAFLAAVSVAACAFFTPSVPHTVILATLFVGGVFRSLQMMSINALAFADIGSEQASHATSLSAMAQRLSQSLGVALAAFVLHVAMSSTGPTFGAFPIAFISVAVLLTVAGLLFMGLSRDAGAELAGRAVVPKREGTTD